MKKILIYLPSHFLACLAVGIILQFQTKSSYHIYNQLLIPSLLLFTLLIAVHYFKWKYAFILITSLLFMGIGMSSVSINTLQNDHVHYTKFPYQQEPALLEIQDLLKTGTYHNRYIARVLQINQIKLKGKLILNIRKDSTRTRLNIGDKLLLKPDFKRISPPLNPYQFDYQSYLEKQDITHQIYTEDREFKLLHSKHRTLQTVFKRTRAHLQRSLHKYNFDKDVIAVMEALLLGQRQNISSEIGNSYRNAGAMHILAISGLHIGILLLVLNTLLNWLTKIPYGKLIKSIIIIALLWSFAAIAGLSASVVRAVTMFTFVLIGQSLLCHPMFLFDVGFQLSYIAVFGIIWIQPRLYNLYQSKYRAIDKLWQLVTVSLAAQLAILPISLFYFKQFPSLFMLSNIVIIPVLGILLILGIVVLVLASVKMLPQFLVDTYNSIIHVMNNYVHWIASQEDFLITEISISVWIMIALYCFMASAFYVLIYRKTTNFIIMLMVTAITQSILIIEKRQRIKRHEFLIFHKNRHAVIGLRQGSELHLYHDLDTIAILQQRLISDYRIGAQVTVSYSKMQPAIFKVNQHYVIRIDSLALYDIHRLKAPIVILQYSPKLNLERLIETLQPKYIIADGTNYKTYITLWKNTCLQKKTPFCYTGQNGAYTITY